MELPDYSLGRILVTILLLGFIGLFTRLLEALILKPSRIRSKLREQGLQGPPSSFLLGNLREVMKIRFKGSTLLPKREGEQVITHDSCDLYPFYDQWKEQYGSTFTFSIGNATILNVSDPNLVKEMSICTSLDLGRSSFFQKGVDPLVGFGIVNSDGPIWAHERKTIAPEFYTNKVKGMMKIIADSATMVVKSWDIMIDNEGAGVADIKIDDFLRRFAGDVISRACFGRNYDEAEEIFSKIRDLQETLIKTFIPQVIPGLRYLPTNNNKQIWRLEKEIRTLIFKMVKKRKEAASENDLLLQEILQSARSNELGEYTMEDFIVDNCKSIYLAGYETTGVSATWTLMLLALHPDWQDKVRAEVLEVCGTQMPNSDMLRQMKLLTMVINESLRLYPPFSTILRGTREGMKIGNIHVPKGVDIWIPIVKLQQDFDIWGDDADKFNPDRFAKGVRHACKFPQAYIPFGFGSHICLGQQLGLVELKMLLALIISKFTLSISPNYRHLPCVGFAIEPEFGVDLLVRKLQL